MYIQISATPPCSIVLCNTFGTPGTICQFLRHFASERQNVIKSKSGNFEEERQNERPSGFLCSRAKDNHGSEGRKKTVTETGNRKRTLFDSLESDSSAHLKRRFIKSPK